MEKEKVYTVIGLMSGTSTDGVDAALLRTNGTDVIESLGFLHIPYEKSLRTLIKEQFGKSECDETTKAIEREITLRHADAVNTLRSAHGNISVDLIGFHGQTIFHDPDNHKTIQIGDGALLASETGCDVVHDFRTADIQAGGQGAPLIPLYHQALVKSLRNDLPCVFLNIGGVGNVTWVGEHEDDLIAFDCGAGNALIDDVMMNDFDKPFDDKGLIAKKGQCNEQALRQLMSHEYFTKKPPKSLDRDAWDVSMLEGLSPEDKVATLTEFTIQGVMSAQKYFSGPARVWYVCGGGRHNDAIMEGLNKKVSGETLTIDTLGVDGDALEAEGFGYLAVRSVKGLPLSIPSTTGVMVPQTGGVLNRYASR